MNPGKFVWQEIIWLRQHGDRTENDVLKDTKGRYVFMGSGEYLKWDRVYLPRYDVDGNTIVEV